MNLFKETFDKLYNWANANSLSPVVFASSCCGAEIIPAIISDKSIEGLDFNVFGSNPKHSDLLIVAGTITHKSAPILLHLYEQMQKPKYVIALGACACSGGMFCNSSYSVVNGIDKIIPTDIYIPMCPPNKEAINDALNKLKQNIKNGTTENNGTKFNNLQLYLSEKQDILICGKN